MKELLRQCSYINTEHDYKLSEKIADEFWYFITASTEDKKCYISSLYGIFDATMKGNIYTYYFWSSDVSVAGVFNYSGKRREREWRKLAKCYRVDYNIKTDEAKVKQTRWNKRCIENAGRTL